MFTLVSRRCERASLIVTEAYALELKAASVHVRVHSGQRHARRCVCHLKLCTIKLRGPNPCAGPPHRHSLKSIPFDGQLALPTGSHSDCSEASRQRRQSAQTSRKRRPSCTGAFPVASPSHPLNVILTIPRLGSSSANALAEASPNPKYHSPRSVGAPCFHITAPVYGTSAMPHRPSAWHFLRPPKPETGRRQVPSPGACLPTSSPL